MIRRCSSLTLFAVVAVAGLCAAEDLSLDEAMAAIKEQPFVTSYKADININVSASGMEMKSTGKVAYDPPRMKMISQMQMGTQTMTTVVAQDANGIQWTESQIAPGITQVMKMDMVVMDETFGVLPGLPQIASGGVSYQPGPEMWEEIEEAMHLEYGGIEIVEGAECHVIKGTYKQEVFDEVDQDGQLRAMGMDKMTTTMYVRIEDSFPVWIKMDSGDGKFATDVLTTNVQSNPEFAEDDLSYTPPSGAPVMDMTEMMRQQMQLETGGTN